MEYAEQIFPLRMFDEVILFPGVILFQIILVRLIFRVYEECIQDSLHSQPVHEVSLSVHYEEILTCAVFHISAISLPSSKVTGDTIDVLDINLLEISIECFHINLLPRWCEEHVDTHASLSKKVYLVHPVLIYVEQQTRQQ